MDLLPFGLTEQNGTRGAIADDKRGTLPRIGRSRLGVPQPKIIDGSICSTRTARHGSACSRSAHGLSVSSRNRTDHAKRGGKHRDDHGNSFHMVAPPISEQQDAPCTSRTLGDLLVAWIVRFATLIAYRYSANGRVHRMNGCA